MPGGANFAGAVPETYQQLLVPLIFEPYAVDLAERTAMIEPRDILEIAAGTGVVTRALAARLDPRARIVATDLSPAMLAVAQARGGNDPHITWQTADAMALPFDRERFDAVLCQFGVMFFPDKVHAYRQVLNTLKPGGRFLFSVWDGVETNEFAHCVSDALRELFPEQPMDFIERLPHGYFDTARIGRELAEAGFASVVVDAVSSESRAPSAAYAAAAYCQGTPLRPEIDARAPGEIEAVTARVAERIAARFGAGEVQGGIRAFIFSAQRPG